MSYILDAIKKTESGQKDGDVPNLNSEHQHTAFMEEDETKRWLLPLLVVIAVLFSVVIWLLMKPVTNNNAETLLANNSEQVASTQKTESEKQLEMVETTTTVSVNSNGVNDSGSEPLGVPEAAGLIITKSPLEVQQPVVQRSPTQAIETVSRRPVTEVVDSTQTQQPVARQASNNKPEYLAAIDHDHWPTLIYTTHIYATKPEDRFVMLNGKAYSIGDTITKGMVVKDILENDLLIDYQGQKIIVPSLTDVNP